MAVLLNLARVYSSTTGTGDVTLGAAVPGCLTFEDAGINDGETVSYAIKNGLQSEVGRGVFTASGPTLSRTPIKSTDSDAAINLAGESEVFITGLAEDFGDLQDQIDALADVASSGDYNDLLNKPTLATVATSGDYDDLTDKPDLSGYVTGPSSATANGIPRYSGTGGKDIKDSPVTINDSGAISIPANQNIAWSNGAGYFVGYDTNKSIYFYADPSNNAASSDIRFYVDGAHKVRINSAAMTPGVDGGSDLGSSSARWGNFFLVASKALNWDNGDYTLVHTTGVLTANKDLRVTTPGTNSASVVTRALTASDTVAGLVELATEAETVTGTDTARAVTPKDLATARATYAAFRASNTSSQTTVGTLEKIVADNELFDRGSYFASNKWTPPAGLVLIGGSYLLTSGFADTNFFRCEIWKNGSLLQIGPNLRASGTASQGPQMTMVDLANGSDYYELYYNGVTGGVISATSVSFWGVQLPTPLA